MKNLKKFIIPFFLFLNYNPANSLEITSLKLKEFDKIYLFSRELTVLKSKESIAFYQLANTLIDYLHFSYNHFNLSDNIQETLNFFKEFLSEEIKNLDINNKTNKELLNIFQIFQRCKNLNIGNHENTINNIKNIITEDIISTSKIIKIEEIEEKMEEIIKNYITLRATKLETVSKIIDEFKIFFSEEIKNINKGSYIHSIAIDIFKIFINEGDITATFVALRLPMILSRNLKTLNLSHNEIGNVGIKVLSKSISNYMPLTLNLSNNEIGDSGLNALIEAFSKNQMNQNLITTPDILYLANNKITSAGVKKLTDTFNFLTDNIKNYYIFYKKIH